MSQASVLTAPKSINSAHLKHVMAMMVVALASPMIYVDPQPLSAWALVWTGPVVISFVIYLLAKFIAPKRAPSAGSFITLGWVLLAVMLFAQWGEYSSATRPTKQNAGPAFVEPAPAKNTFSWEEAQFPASR